MKLSKIKPNPDNPRVVKDEKFEKLVKSIKEFPKMMELRPMVVDSDNIVLGGNMRLKALKELGYKEIPDTWVKCADELSEEEKKRFIIADNVGFGQWDWDTLANEWDEQQLIDWGLDIPDFEEEEIEAVEDDYTEPEQMQVDVVEGDLIEFACDDGRVHRLLCGDSTCSDSVAKLMDGKKADMVFTDPPYNIAFTPPRGTHESILNDNMSDSDFKQFLRDVFSLCDSVMKNDTILISFMGWSTVSEFQEILKEIFTIKSMPVWVKNNFGIGYFTRPKYEPSFLCLKGNPKKPNKAPSDVFECAKVHKTIHSCQKPIGLIKDMVIPFSKSGDLFFEPFSGSGSTLVAAHQLNRICYGVELDPKYCQVIIDRMTKLDETLTVKINGKEYKKEVNEVPF